MAVKTEKQTRYLRLRDDLRRKIITSEAGTRLPSTRQLMKRHKVSQLLVERCFYDLEKQGLLERRDRSGVYVASQASKAYLQAKIFGVLLSGPPNAGDEHFQRGLKAAAKPDKSLILSYTSSKHMGDELEANRESSRPDLHGVALCIHDDENPAVAEALTAMLRHFRIPPVLFGDTALSIRADRLILDWRQIAEQILHRGQVREGAVRIVVDPRNRRMGEALAKGFDQCDVCATIGSLDEMAAETPNGLWVAVGIDPNEFHEKISWRDVEHLRHCIALSWRESAEAYSRHVPVGVLPHAEMGAEAYRLLSTRMNEPQSWYPKARSFSMTWEWSIDE